MASAPASDRRLRPGNGKRRVYSRVFLGRLLVTLKRCRDTLGNVLAAILPPSFRTRKNLSKRKTRAD